MWVGRDRANKVFLWAALFLQIIFKHPLTLVLCPKNNELFSNVPLSKWPCSPAAPPPPPKEKEKKGSKLCL